MARKKKVYDGDKETVKLGGRGGDARAVAQLQDGRWWAAEDEMTLATRIRTVLERIHAQQSFLRTEYAQSWRLYENTPIAGLTPRLYRPRTSGGRVSKISWNLVKSVVDTYVSLITDERPKVTFLTAGGNRTLQRRAKKLEKFIDGVLYENEFYELVDQIVRDSAIFGRGVIKVYASYDNPKKPCIKIERMFAYDDHTDEQDAVYGDPQSKQFIYWVDKYALAEKYEDKAAEILRTNTDVFLDGGAEYAIGGQNNFAVVVESWHLPTVPGTKEEGGTEDGRHVISVGDVVLEDEPWSRADFGLVTLYRQKPIQGIWAQSLPTELAPLQVEIAKYLWNISLAQRRAVGHWLVENGSDISTSVIDDRVGSIFRFTGTKPFYEAPAMTTPSDVYSHLNTLWQRGFEVVGISANMAASERPAGLNSGKAQLVYADIQQKRFQPSYRQYQQFFLRLARTIIRVAREIEEKTGDAAWGVTAIGKREFTNTIKWADAKLEEEQFRLQMFATNKLEGEPAARFEIIQEMINSGWIDQPTGKRLMDLPDLEQEESYEFAPYNFVTSQLDKILDDDVYAAPDPMLGDFLPKAIEIGAKYYLKARLDGVEEKTLAMVVKWIDVCKSYVAPPANDANGTAPPAGGAPPPGAPPPGGPQAPGSPLQQQVQSDMMRREASAEAQNAA